MTTQQQALIGVNNAFTPSNAAQATALAGVNAAFAPTVPTTAPTGTTSTTDPAATPTPVASSTTAAGHYNSTIVPGINDASTASANAASIRAANKANAAAGLIPADQANSNTFVTPQPKPTPPPTTPTSPLDQALNQADPGNQWVYDTTTGAKTQQPTNVPLTANQTTTDLVNAPAVATAQTATTNIKQYADGTYGVFDSTTGAYLGQGNQKYFNAAQQQQKADADMTSIENGTYPLTPDQQGTLDSIRSYYAKLIDNQTQANTSLTNAVTGQNYMTGIAGSYIGVDKINKTISDGALKIQQLNDEMNAKLAAAKDAIKAGNIDMVQKAYNQFTDTVNAKQKILDQMHQDALQAVKDKQAEQDKQDQLIATQNNETDASIRSAIANAAQNGATSDQITAMKQALTNHDFAAAVSAGGDALQQMSGDFADYPQYKKDALANGVTPLDPTTWLAKKQATDAKQKSNEAYATAFAAEKGRSDAAAQEDNANGSILQPVTSQSGITYNVPANVAPYVKISPSGVKYIDVSALSAAEKGKIQKAAYNNGVNPIPVITDPSAALDVQNIADATAKLQDMKSAFDGVTADSAAARDTYYAAAITMANKLQTDPNAVGLDIYQDAALDILKAMSGTKGFRGGTSMVNAVKASFPTRTDTQAVVDTKIANMQKLIDDRQTSLIGNPSTGDQAIIDAVNVKNKPTGDLINSILSTNTAPPQSSANFWSSIITPQK